MRSLSLLLCLGALAGGALPAAAATRGHAPMQRNLHSGHQRHGSANSRSHQLRGHRANAHNRANHGRTVNHAS